MFTTTRSLCAAVAAIGPVLCWNNGTVSAARYYVDAAAGGANSGVDWPNAFTELQSALAVAVAGDDIWVARGVYKPDYDPASGTHTQDRARSFRMYNLLNVYGGFLGNARPGGGETLLSERNADPMTNNTVLSGDLAGDDGPSFANRADNSYQVVRYQNLSGPLDYGIIDGFTIRGGNADGAGLDLRAGGGINVVNGWPLIRRCLIIDNQALSYGGGIETVGVAYPTIEACRLIGNKSDQGGGLHQSGPVIVMNSLFVGNFATPGLPVRGAAIQSSNGSLTLTNCTIAHHDAASVRVMGVGIGGAFGMTNCILWANGDGTEGGQITGTVLTGNIQRSCIQGWTGALGGVANTGADPKFWNPLGADGVAGTLDDDLRLLPISPLIDAGDNMADIDANDAGVQPLSSLDVLGNARFIDHPFVPDTGVGTPPIVDLGAIETVPLDDTDGDGVDDVDDNCWLTPNAGQENADGDAAGDVCDNCIDTVNDDQLDTDGDTVGDACDNCPMVANADQANLDGDETGDACDPDYDDDGLLNEADNCPRYANSNQTDEDNDGVGDVCDPAVGTWTVPVPFEPANSPVPDRAIAFAADGLSFYVATERDGNTGNPKIYRATRSDTSSEWSSPQPVAELMATGSNLMTWVSPDGLEACLHRYVFPLWTNGAIYRTHRTGVTEPWGTPVLLGELDAPDAADRSFTVTADNLHGMFDSNRSGGMGGFDLYTTSRASTGDAWSSPVPVSILSSGSDDADPLLSADGLRVVFASRRPGGFGSYDIYMSRRDSVSDLFQPPVRIPELSSVYADGRPAFGPDGRLYFTRDCCAGMDIHVSTFIPHGTDDDLDGVPIGSDNCPAVANPGQRDGDNDGAGDACDAPSLLAAVSRRSHGDAGDFDIDLPPAGAAVEGRRSSEEPGRLRLVLTFSEPVSGAGGAEAGCAHVTLSAGVCASVTPLASSMLQVELSDAPSNACIALALANLFDADGLPLDGDGDVRIRFIPGDADGDGIVNVVDLNAVKSSLFATPDASIFRRDVNGDGVINVVDLNDVKGNLFGTAVCP